MAFSFGQNTSGSKFGQQASTGVSGFSFSAKPSFSFGAATAAPAPNVGSTIGVSLNAQQNITSNVPNVQKTTKFSELSPDMQKQIVAIDTAIKEQGRILAEVKSTDLPELISSVGSQVEVLFSELSLLQDAFQLDKNTVDELKPAAFHDLGIAETLQRKLDELKKQQSLVQSSSVPNVDSSGQKHSVIAAVDRHVANSLLQADNELILKYYKGFYEQAVSRANEHQKTLRDLSQSAVSLMFFFSPSQQRQLFQKEPEQLVDTAKSQAQQLRQLWTRLSALHDQVCDFIAKLKQLRDQASSSKPLSTQAMHAHDIIASNRLSKQVAFHKDNMNSVAVEQSFKPSKWMSLKEAASFLNTSESAPAATVQQPPTLFSTQQPASGLSFGNPTVQQPKPVSFSSNSLATTTPAANPSSAPLFGGVGPAKPQISVNTNFGFKT